MDINLTNKDGVKLKTAGKYCAEDINVIPQLDTATVTPAKGQQVVQPSNNKIGFSSVTVEAIPDDYIIPSGTQQITENGTYDVSGKANAVVNVPTAKPEQTKTVDLAMASGNQVVTPDSGKVLTQITINKPSTLVAGNIKSGVSIGGVTGTLESAKEEQTKTVEITSNGSFTVTPDSGKVLSQVTGTVNVPTSGGGADLNIAYGDTAPTDTSKLWIKSTKPASIDFTQNPEQQVQGITSEGLPNLPFGSYLIGHAAVGTKIYLFGGVKQSSTSNAKVDTIQEFDTETKTITTLSTRLIKKGYGPTCVAVGTKIYIFGFGVPNIQAFDTISKSITLLSATLLGNGTYISCAAIGTKIYLFYAPNSSNSQILIQEFDTTTNTLTTLLTETEKYRGAGCVAIGNKIYLFGGGAGSADTGYINKIKVFDTEQNILTDLSLTTAAKGNIAAEAVGNKIFLFGGYDGTNYYANIQEFIVTFALSSGNILVQEDYLNNVFDVLPAPTRVQIGVRNVYKGNASNEAEFVDAYIHNGTNWVNVNTGGGTEQ